MDPLTTDERIAALLDGKLDEQERAALLAELGLSRDELEILLNSAATQAELEEEDLAAGVIPITTARRGEGEPRGIVRPPIWRRPAVLSAAAGLVLAVGCGLLLARRSPTLPVSAVEALAEPGRTLPASVPDPWPVTRGGGGDLGPALSVRYGALAAELEMAAKAGDHARFTTIATSVADLLTRGDHRVASRDYAVLASSSTLPSLASLERLRQETAESLDRERVVFGDWLEAARVAEWYRDTGFFRADASRRYLENGAKLDLTRAAQQAIKAIRAAIPPDGDPDWAKVKQALSVLLEEVG